MTDKKFTDEEIIRALELCSKSLSIKTCQKCPFYLRTNCVSALKLNAIDLINRQKAEIERLKQKNKKFKVANRCITLQRDRRDKEINELQKQIDGLDVHENKIKAEACKEFAEALSNKAEPDENHHWWVRLLDIDNLLKEMVGDE